MLVAGGLLASGLFDLGAHGVALVGDVPRGLPAPVLPDLALVARPLRDGRHRGGVALLLIGFSQTAGDARAFAARHDYRIDVNQESVAQGMANLGRRRVPGHAGVDEPLGQLAERVGRRAHAGVVAGHRRARPRDPARARAAVLDLPKAVLGAVIIDAVVFGMIDVAELRRLYRVARFDFWIAVAAIVGVLSAGVLAGVVIGVVLSLGWLVYVATRPPMPLLGREPGTQVFRDLDEHPEDETFPGIAVLRLDGGLFFATAEALEDRVRGSPTTAVRARWCSISRASTSSTRRARRSSPSSIGSGRTAAARPGQAAGARVLEADGFIDLIGADHVHGNVHRAVEAEIG